MSKSLVKDLRGGFKYDLGVWIILLEGAVFDGPGTLFGGSSHAKSEGVMGSTDSSN